MTELTGALIAMGVGVLGTSTIHLSKGVMRLGLVRLRTAEANKRRASMVYTAGILMNFTNPFWVILANRFAPTVFYTSMYGLGLLSLVVFSRYKLHERLHGSQYVGILIIIVGTLLVGFGNLMGGKASLYGANSGFLITVAILWLVLTPLFAVVLRRGSVGLQELYFGLTAGGLAALEAMVKGVSQAGAVSNTFLPQTTFAWWLFLASFLGAAGAFGMIQWSYLRHCRASLMGSVYDVAYVGMPLLLTAAIVEGAGLGVWKVAGLIVLIVGVLMVGRRGATERRVHTYPRRSIA
jgi:drug/metabolite transporter (DMT)-like permease